MAVPGTESETATVAGTVAATAVAETVTGTVTVTETVTVAVTAAVTNTVTAAVTITVVATAVSMSMKKKLIFPQHGTDTGVREPAFTTTIETDQGPFSLKIAPTKAHCRSGTAVGRCWAALEDHNSESSEIHTVLLGFWQVARNGLGGLGGA